MRHLTIYILTITFLTYFNTIGNSQTVIRYDTVGDIVHIDTFKLIKLNRLYDLTNLDTVKVGMTGQWLRIFEKTTIEDNFTFVKNSYNGSCSSKKNISTAPIFTLVRQDNKTIIRWHDLADGGYDATILELTQMTMIIQYGEKTLKYFKK